MANKPTRQEFIDKLRTLELTLDAQTRPFDVGEPHESRGVVHWEVDGFIRFHEADKGIWEAEPLGLNDLEHDEDGQLRRWIFWMKGMTIHLDVVDNAWDVLDARDIDSSHFTPLIDPDTGQFVDELRDLDSDAYGASSLVIIDRAEVADGWRGNRGLGRTMIQKAIDLVADPAGMSLVALEAHPYLEESGGRTASEEAVAATERTWESMGFKRVGDSEVFIRGTSWISPYDDVDGQPSWR